MERVLVVFQATTAKTESLALAFGLGAVEGGALIRLRHLNSDGPCELEHQGYGPPKEADLEWAQAIGLALESAETAPEVDALLEQLGRLADRKKAVYVFGGAAGMSSVAHTQAGLKALGAALVGADSAAADADTARAVGRQVASQA